MQVKLWMVNLLLIGFFLNGNGNPSFSQEKKERVINLQQLINEALRNNPDYLAAKNRWRSAEAYIPQAGALPDPQFGLALMNLPVNSFAFDQEPMTGKKISLMQMFPFPGKLGLKEDIAKYQAHIIEQQVEELKNNIIKNVKFGYYNLFFIDKSIEITKKNKVLLQEFVKIAATKYSVGKGLQQDVLKAQVELSKLTDKLITLRQKRESIEARLNTLLNRPPEAPVGAVEEIKKSAFIRDLEQLKQIALKSRPLLKAWAFMIKRNETAHKLAKRDYLPNFGFGVAYTQREDLKEGMKNKMYDFFSGSVTINIPLYFYRKQSKKIQETALNLAAVQEQYNNVKNEIFFQIENVRQQAQKDEQLIDLFKTGIIPQATQSLNSAVSGYQVDKIDFITMLHNQLTLFNYEIDYYRVLADYEKNLADMEAIVGKQLVE